MRAAGKGRSWAGRKRAAALGAVMAAVCMGITAILLHEGILPFNDPSKALYPVRGVDVSQYQGEIDWDAFSAQGIDFAFIRATEGSGHTDERFACNWQMAAGKEIRIGAYHFFSFDSPGRTQAENFIRAVTAVDGMLPPVVDVELYGAYKKSPKPGESVWPELDMLLDALEGEYGQKPILYATKAAYDLYLSGRYESHPLWIRSVYGLPAVQNWAFWQYSHRGRLDGYQGEERFIDLNVYHGSREAFDKAFP